MVATAIEALRDALAQQGAYTDPDCLTRQDEIIRKLAKENAELDSHIDQLIQERDHRDEIIDKLCDAVLGPDRYEWSNMYFFEDAVREVEERMEALAQQGEQPVAWYDEEIDCAYTATELDGGTSEGLIPLYAGAAPAAQPTCKQDLPVETTQERYVRLCPDIECGRKKRCTRMVGVSCMSRADIDAAPAAQPLSDEYDEGYAAGRQHGEMAAEEARAYKDAYFKLMENVASLKALEPPPPIILQAAPAAQPHVTPNQAARFRAQHLFLEWNRAQKDLPVAIAMEYHVFQNAIDLYFEAVKLNGIGVRK